MDFFSLNNPGLPEEIDQASFRFDTISVISKQRGPQTPEMLSFLRYDNHHFGARLLLNPA
ncbi:MAG TPA: hypothetical protein DCE14_01520 [Kosmotogaceae bacterium]|nr:hypothetical protein [Kosmotogaceae bacterium]